MPTFREDLHLGHEVPVFDTDDLQDGCITERKLRDAAVTLRKLAADVIDYISTQIADAVSNAVSMLRGEHKADMQCVNERISHLSAKHCKDIKTINDELADLRNQIDAHSDHGGFVSNQFGDDPHIAVSQKTTTAVINRLWQKIEDITGEILQGINMTVTPDYFISEDGATVHITASTVEANGIFEKIQFFANGTLIAEYENTEYAEFDTHIDESTVIMCKAKIMGIEYTRQRLVIHYNSFFIGAGTSYDDVMNVEHVQPVTRGIRGQYEVTAAAGDRIFIILGESLRNAFIRADISFTEIGFTEQVVTLDGKNYCILASENTYEAGTYKVFING